jgi:protein-disulfide isomerase
MQAISAALSLILLFAFQTSVRAETVATVAGESISREDVEKRVRPQLIEIENNRYEVLEQGLSEAIAEKLLDKEAKARGVSVEALRKTEIADKVPAPTDEMIQQLYDANKAQLGDQTFEELKPKITEYLAAQGAATREGEFIEELKKKHATTITLAPPKVEVDTAGRASRGGDSTAPVTIVAFSDYECPYCKRAEATVAQVMENYGKEVRYVMRDFPLPFHANAHAAAQAARCAGDQGKYWEYNDKMFQAADLQTSALQQTATDLQLDRTKFDECLSSGKYKAQVDADIAAGSEVGVNGTPAFFINGRMISGAQPFEKFKEIIDAEIARTKTATATP